MFQQNIYFLFRRLFIVTFVADSVSPTTLEPETTPATSNSNSTKVTCDCDYCELPVPDDCTAYVLCIDRVAYKMHCGPDLYFNSMTGTCDFKENVDCIHDGLECTGQSGRYLLEESYPYFVECHGKNKTLRACPEGLQFSQATEMCSWTGTSSGNFKYLLVESFQGRIP